MAILRTIARRLQNSRRIFDRLCAIKPIPQMFEEIAERDKKSLTKLAQMGWFFGPHMAVSAIPRLGRAVESHPDEVDEYFGRHIRANLDEIEEELVRYCPHRSEFLEKGFKAHREGDYEISISIFLQQADGIFNDRYGRAGAGNESLFTKRSREKQIKTFIESEFLAGRSIMQAHLHPFTESIPLWKGTRDLEDTFKGLNRHQVMHGTSVRYGTELNSLKAVSLLSCLSWVLYSREVQLSLLPP